MKKLQSNRKHNNTELVRIHKHVSYYFNFCPKHIKAVHKKKNNININRSSFPIQSLLRQY